MHRLCYLIKNENSGVFNVRNAFSVSNYQTNQVFILRQISITFDLTLIDNYLLHGVFD